MDGLFQPLSRLVLAYKLRSVSGAEKLKSNQSNQYEIVPTYAVLFQPIRSPILITSNIIVRIVSHIYKQTP